MKIKISKTFIWIILGIAIVSLVALSGCIDYPQQEPITMWDYHGTIVVFRDDLRKADKIPAYPSETAIYLDTIHPLVKNVTIAFKDAGEEENPYYIVEIFEIIKQMTLAYQRLIDSYEVSPMDMPTFNAIPVENYANLPGKIQNPIIALVHPKYANETAVRNDFHVTYISGKTHEEFDLATIKFLMIVLGIDLEPEESGN